MMFLTSCENLNSPNNRVNVAVRRMLSKYIAANNNRDHQMMSAIVSDKFDAGGQGKNSFVVEELATKKEYDRYTLTSITRPDKQLENVVANVDFKASIKYQPEVDIPIFEGNLPELKGHLSQRCLIDVIEENGEAVMKSYYNYAWMEAYEYGPAPPVVAEFYPVETTAQAGSDLKLYFSLARRRPGTFLTVIINGKIVSGSSLEQVMYSNSHILIVPTDAKGMYFVELVVLEGEFDANNSGTKMSEVSISIRKLGLPVK